MHLRRRKLLRRWQRLKENDPSILESAGGCAKNPNQNAQALLAPQVFKFKTLAARVCDQQNDHGWSLPVFKLFSFQNYTLFP